MTATPGAKQVGTAVTCRPPCRTTIMLREGLLRQAYRDFEPPFVPGMDVAGTIDEIGDGVDHAYGLTVGDDVVGIVS